MNHKTIHKIGCLIMALFIAMGNTIHTQTSTAAALTAGPSVYWGAMVQGKVPSSTNLQGVFSTFETRSGKKMSIIHWGQSWILGDGSWGEFQTTYFDNVRNHGSIPMLNWASQRFGGGLNQPDFQLRDVYAGTYDAYIQRWATAAKNWGHPFFLYFNPEMNGWWYPWAEGRLPNGTIINGNSPGDYVLAWRHVHDIFTAVGATNVSWVWAPNHYSTSSQYPALSTLYPGDAYVDWTGLSVYNKYPTWAGLNPLMTGSEGMTWFRNSYSDVLSLAPNKPMMLAQVASIEAGDGGAKKAAWITDALTTQIPVNFPRIKAIVWFNWQETPDETYPIESSQAATDAWAAGIASPVYATNQYSRLNTSPIPEPAPNTFTISGNVGTSGATLIYTDGGEQFAISDGNGNYSISVPLGWSGSITPHKVQVAFTPGNRSYNNVQGNISSEDYRAQGCASCADRDTVGVFRPSNGLLYLKNLNITGYADVAINYGMGGDYPVTGDWNGDGIATIGIYRNGSFYLRNSNTIGYADTFFQFGTPGDQPIAGDWNGDGIDTIGVYNSATITFYLRDSNTAGPPDYVFRLGLPGDVGIAGDWTKKGYDTVGVFRPSNGVIFLKNTNQTGYADIALNYGLPGDKPVVGDWDSNGTDTIGILRGNSFYLRNSNTIGYADMVFSLGIPGDMPIAGDWDAKP